MKTEKEILSFKKFNSINNSLRNWLATVENVFYDIQNYIGTVFNCNIADVVIYKKISFATAN